MIFRYLDWTLRVPAKLTASSPYLRHTVMHMWRASSACWTRFYYGIVVEPLANQNQNPSCHIHTN